MLINDAKPFTINNDEMGEEENLNPEYVWTHCKAHIHGGRRADLAIKIGSGIGRRSLDLKKTDISNSTGRCTKLLEVNALGTIKDGR